MRRGLLPAVAAVALLSCSATAATAASRQHLQSPRLQDVGLATAIPDSIVTARTVRKLSLAKASWGGQVTAASGEQVTVLVSDSYAQDAALVQRWADFLVGLVHGSELSTVTVFLATPAEVSSPSLCGLDALACYSPDRSLIISPGEDPEPGTAAEAVLAHEFGHHVAASRSNAPWAAVDYGTKRWASHEQVCRKAQAGRLFPGAEDDPARYRLNPGEGFAESYRVLNERRVGIPSLPWAIVSDSLYPDDTALSLIEQDVRQPWTATTTATSNGSLARAGAKVRTRTIATTLDGRLRVTLRAPAAARLRLDLLTASGRRVGRATLKGGSRTLETTICGSRSYRIRVSRLAGAGTYRLSVSKP